MPPSPPRFAPGGRIYSLTESNRASIHLLGQTNSARMLSAGFYPQRLFASNDVCYIFGQKLGNGTKNPILITFSEINSQVPQMKERALPFAGDVLEISPDHTVLLVRSAS